MMTTSLLLQAPCVEMENLENLWFQLSKTACNLKCKNCFLSCTNKYKIITSWFKRYFEGCLSERRGTAYSSWFPQSIEAMFEIRWYNSADKRNHAEWQENKVSETNSAGLFVWTYIQSQLRQLWWEQKRCNQRLWQLQKGYTRHSKFAEIWF